MKEVHYLIKDELAIIQDNRFFKFGTDSVLLANFTQTGPGDLVVDLGSGSGVIPLLLAFKKKPKQIIGVEIQPELVELARQNIASNNLEDKIEIMEVDLCNLASLIRPGSVDVIVTNPPYMPPDAGKITKNKYQAIARHEIKASLDDILKIASKLLKFGGYLHLVHRTWRLGEVLDKLSKYQLIAKEMQMIQARENKEPDTFLLRARKGGNHGLRVKPTLVVYEKNSKKYTPRVREIYGEDS